MNGPLRIELLGGLRVAGGEREITPFRRPKVAALFAYLAFYRERAHPREELIELLWPEIEPEAGRNNLRVTLHLLRRQFAEFGHPGERLFLVQHSAVRLRSDVATTDVAEFEAALRAARSAQPGERISWLTVAVALYRGELLPSSVEPWVLMERQPLAEAYREALQELTGLLEEAGDFEGAKEHARRAVSVDPLWEEAHYDLMRLYAAIGQPEAAVRQYEELERLLRVELEEAPSAATRALAEELRESARPLIVPRALRMGAARAEGRSSQLFLPTRAAHQPTRREEAVASGAGDLPREAAAAPPPAVDPGPLLHRLPAQFTRFYGREEEIARLCEALGSRLTSIASAPENFAGGRLATNDGPRLVTLTGPGGSGKTRLAIAAAGRLEAEFAADGGGLWFVPLAELAEASLIPDAIISALGLCRARWADPWDQIFAALRGRRSLLLLDNFEQLLEDGAPLVRRLLERVPTLTCLVTSRRRLQLEGELECVVLPLPTPVESGKWRVERPAGVGVDLSSLNAPLSTLLHYPSVALFVDRAQAARPDFALTSANAAAVAQLCDRLEGLPLAIELAASRAGVLTPEQMLARLMEDRQRARPGPGEQRSELLVSRRRDVSSRHRSLRAAIDWSYRLLAPELQSFFAQLSVFRGGWNLEAAETVCQTPAALEYLDELRHASLVQIEEAPDRHGAVMRYRLLEMLREYAAEQLAPEEREILAGCHAQFFLELAEKADAALHGAEPGRWLDRLEQEHDNFRAALDWCSGVQAFGRSDRTDRSKQEQKHEPGQNAQMLEDRDARTQERLTWGLRLATALARFWFTRGFLREGRERLTAALARITGSPETMALGSLSGSPPAGVDAGLWARALDGAANLALAQSDFATARAVYEQCLAYCEQEGDLPGILQAILCLAVVATCAGSLDAARSNYERSLALAEQLGDRPRVAESLNGLGDIAELEGEYARASSFFERSVPLAREVGPGGCLAWGLHAWGFVTWQQGDLKAGRALLEESLAIFQQTGHRYGLARTLERLAGLARAEGQTERAARLCGAAASLREAIGSPLGPLGQAEWDRELAALHDALGEPAFARARAAGAAMTLEQALQEAVGPEKPPSG